VAAILVSVVGGESSTASRPSARATASAFDVRRSGSSRPVHVEYIARVPAWSGPCDYMRSFFGIVDLLSVLPTYLAFFCRRRTR
jgi:voltage-gated potassium channel